METSYAHCRRVMILNRAYKKLARQYHPDLNKAKNATAEFVGYERRLIFLKTPKRKRYDAALKFTAQALVKSDPVVSAQGAAQLWTAPREGRTKVVMTLM